MGEELGKQVTQKNGRVAKLMDKLGVNTTELERFDGEKTNGEDEKADNAENCDHFLANFDLYADRRSTERDALLEGKAFLQGQQVSLISQKSTQNRAFLESTFAHV